MRQCLSSSHKGLEALFTALPRQGHVYVVTVLWKTTSGKEKPINHWSELPQSAFLFSVGLEKEREPGSLEQAGAALTETYLDRQVCGHLDGGVFRLKPEGCPKVYYGACSWLPFVIGISKTSF